MNEEWYVVNTIWGSFKLDRASYKDYLAGKLWINSKPAEGTQANVSAEATLPSDLSRDAVRLRDLAARNEVYTVLQERFSGEDVPIPYRVRMGSSRIDEMTLSFRASNALMRAGVYSFERLFDLMQGRGLRSIRNLGAKTEREIIQQFFNGCYLKLSSTEQARYWQDLLDGKHREIE